MFFDSCRVVVEFATILSTVAFSCSYSIIYNPIKWSYGYILSRLLTLLDAEWNSVITILFSPTWKFFSIKMGSSFLYFNDDCLWRGLNYFSYLPFIDTVQLSGNKFWFCVFCFNLRHLICNLWGDYFFDFKNDTTCSFNSNTISCFFLPFFINPTKNYWQTTLLGIISLIWQILQFFDYFVFFIHLVW